MSLELALERNTAAIEKLIAILGNAENSAPIAANVAEIDPPKSKRAKKEAAPATLGEQVVPEESAQSPAPTAADAKTTEAAAAPAETKPLTYDDAAAAVTKVVKALGTSKAKELLASFGGKNLKEVDPSRYDELIMNAEELLSPDQP